MTEVRLVAPDGTRTDVAGSADGVRIRSQPLAGVRGSAVVGGLSASAGSRRRCVRLRGVAGVPQADAAARNAERGLRVSESERGRDAVPDGIPWSAGALVDRAGLKGAGAGGARVSLTHGNFIVNEGEASAADIKRLIERCKAAVRDRFGVELREEIVYLGEFDERRTTNPEP